MGLKLTNNILCSVVSAFFNVQWVVDMGNCKVIARGNGATFHVDAPW